VAEALRPLGSTMRMLRPAPNVLAFYDGRIAGARTFAVTPNWVDDGAYVLGVASYAIVAGGDALVYDTHISIHHARLVRQTLQDAGAKRITVVLSHWHLDHVAGNEAFGDCEIIAHAWTAEILRSCRAAIEAGTQSGAPAIDPFVLPTTTYESTLALTVGGIPVELRHVNIHSRDGTMLVLPDRGLLLAGDALEDPITYVAEPDRLEAHLRDLARMAGWGMDRILPNHGAETTIASGGYGPELIAATERYVRELLRGRSEPERRGRNLRALLAEDFAAGTIGWFAPYEAVHRRNVEAVAAA
jgi:glyoxylase-like metal-dependent hydrolase (beta-lactamase superfamily II)